MYPGNLNGDVVKGVLFSLQDDFGCETAIFSCTKQRVGSIRHSAEFLRTIRLASRKWKKRRIYRRGVMRQEH